MSDFRILQDLSLHLQALLFNGLSAAGAPIVARDRISLLSPPQIEALSADDGNQLRLSLYLFHVQPNGQLNNDRFIRIGNTQYASPFYVDVAYLVTPVAPLATDNLTLLGGVIDVLSANGVLRTPFLRLSLQPSRGEARLRMLQYDLENMTKLWGAFTKPYRMSVAYEVTAVPVESLRLPQDGPPVEESILDIQEMHAAV
jgi:hypothetical protein